MVYFRLSTSGLTTGPPSSYTQPQSGLKPRHEAEQGSASLNTVSASEGVVSGAQNCGCPLTKQVIKLPCIGTVQSTWMATANTNYVCIPFLVLWKMFLKLITRCWVNKRQCHEKCCPFVHLFRGLCGVFTMLSARHHSRHCAYLYQAHSPCWIILSSR